jgi:hypothetical protein
MILFWLFNDTFTTVSNGRMIVNDELESMWDVVEGYLRYCPRICLVRTKSSLCVTTRAVWKVRGLTAVRRCYAEGGGDSYAKS